MVPLRLEQNSRKQSENCLFLTEFVQLSTLNKTVTLANKVCFGQEYPTGIIWSLTVWLPRRPVNGSASATSCIPYGTNRLLIAVYVFAGSWNLQKSLTKVFHSPR